MNYLSGSAVRDGGLSSFEEDTLGVTHLSGYFNGNTQNVVLNL